MNKPRDGESLVEYAKRHGLDIEDMVVAERDHYTKETRFVGYGWYPKESDMEGDEE